MFQIDGKLLCWLCTLSYKRALARARQVESERRMSKKRPSTDKPAIKEINQKAQRSDVSSANNKQPTMPEIPEKIARIAVANTVPVDQNSSEHVVAMTQLKEQIASLNKRLKEKDRELLGKDKLITELKSKNFVSENELRTKMKDNEKFFARKEEVLNKKLAALLKEVAQLMRGSKKGGGGGGGGGVAAVAVAVGNKNGDGAGSEANSNDGGGNDSAASGKESGGSGTDSPNTN